MPFPRRIVFGLSSLAVIIAISVTGYMLIEGWSFIDALYMTVIPLTTVGYYEIHPLSQAGRIFAMIIIVGGVGAAIFTITGLIQYLFEGEFSNRLRRRRMINKIAALNDHFIICGYDRVGREVAHVFTDEDVSFVIVDRDQEIVDQARQAGHPVLQGDATSDEVLKQAGVERARGLVAALGSDIDNTYVVLSARGLNPRLMLVARASSEDAEIKLRRAGADRVILPQHLGGRRMALLALRPLVVEFVDTIMHSRELELLLEEIEVTGKCQFSGRSLAEARDQAEGAIILAIKKKSGQLIANPPKTTGIEIGDQLVVMGTREQLTALECRM